MASNSNASPVPLLQLQEEHYDALIICAEDSPGDRDKARELQEAIEGFSFNNGIRGKAIQYEEAIPYGGSRISSLDDALRVSTLCFAIYSIDLEEDRINWQTANATLWHAIVNEARRETFIPVIWTNGATVPAYARERQELDMRRDNWRNRLNRLINTQLVRRLGREREQQQLRSRYPDLSRPTATYNDDLSRHMLMPSRNQNDHLTMDRQESLANIDVHVGDTRPHDVDANGHRAPPFLLNYMGSLNSGRCLGVLGFVIISVIMIRWKAR